MTYRELKEKWETIGSLSELNNLIGNSDLSDKSSQYWDKVSESEGLADKWKKLNKLAVKMYFCKSIESEKASLAAYKTEMIAILWDMALNSFRNTADKSIIKLFKCNWTLDAFMSVVEKIDKYSLENQNAGSFQKFFFNVMRGSVKGERQKTFKENNNRSVYDSVSGDIDDNTCLKALTGNDIPFEERVSEPLLVIQIPYMLRQLADFEDSLEIGKAHGGYFRLFYTHDSIGVIKCEDYRKYEPYQREMFNAFVIPYIDYVHTEPCATVRDIHDVPFREEVRFNETKTVNDKTVEGIYIQDTEMSKYLLFDKYSGEILQYEEYDTELGKQKTKISQARSTYGKYMRQTFIKYEL